jgi:hypothetical protein
MVKLGRKHDTRRKNVKISDNFLDITKHWIQLQNDSLATVILYVTARTILSREMRHETRSTCLWKKREMPRKSLLEIPQKNRQLMDLGIEVKMVLTHHNLLGVKMRTGLK